MPLSFSYKYAKPFVAEYEIDYMQPFVTTAHQMLEEQNGPGNNCLGWLNLPLQYPTGLLEHLTQTAGRIQKQCDIFIVIGIGGSYLGTRAALEFLHSPLYNQTKPSHLPEVYFVGNSISGAYLEEILALCQNKDICVNVISKSGTTTEPAIAFRIFRQLLLEKYGEEGAKSRIFCTTDAATGTLKEMADQSGYQTFAIPANIGGRFSVLTPVGLLPLAVAGANISAILAGAAVACKAYRNPYIGENICYLYATLRNILRNKHKSIEVLALYEPQFAVFGEWYKQLFGESEGKDGMGIFPTSMVFSTDLHSLGQFIQNGSHNLFETVLELETPDSQIVVPAETCNFDKLGFLEGKPLFEINQKAMEGTLLAHVEGGVPNLLLTISERTEFVLGELFYFFEKACAISGYLLGVNPFDQPGVENYKQNMFALLGKPGYEEHRKALEQLF